MMKDRFKKFGLLMAILFISFSCTSEPDDTMDDLPEEEEIHFQKEDHHPFLIVKKEQFEMLRERAGSEPWNSMKADAIARSRAGSKTNAYDLQDYIGAAALAYILDEEHAQTHANRVRDAILTQYAQLDLTDGGGWGGVVPPMGSFFVAILALDIVYNDLTPEEIRACEEVVSSQISKIKRDGSWDDVRKGTHGTWDIYKGNRTTPDDAYYQGIMRQITPDGVSPVTNHYAWERVGGGDSRISKSGYMDVLEFTGIDKRYYNNERLQKFQRWLFGLSVNCAKEMAIFGDMLPTQNVHNDMLHRRVVNFDDEAAGFAAWFHEGRPAIGHILTYILPRSALPEPVVSTSKIYENGGAFFREPENDPKGLHGVLYNIMSQDEWHTHFEVNALALSGLGNRLLVNGGRLGEPVRAAFLNNTLTINGGNHKSRLGGGITEGFTTDGFDYASGFSGPALESAGHVRSLILIHGDGQVQGYFIVLDAVEAASGDYVKNYLHPANETQIAEIMVDQEYVAAIDHFPTITGTNLSFFYVTPPVEVNIEKVPSAVPDRYPGYPDHNRLEAVYPVDPESEKHLATVLFPFDADHPKADFDRLKDGEYHLAVIRQAGGVSDFVFESSGREEEQTGGSGIQARTAVFREVNGELGFWFIREGTFFSSGATTLESNVPVTLYFKDHSGAVVSPGVTLKYTGDGMEGIRFTPPAEVLRRDTGFLEVKLEKGIYTFSL